MMHGKKARKFKSKQIFYFEFSRLKWSYLASLQKSAIIQTPKNAIFPLWIFTPKIIISHYARANQKWNFKETFFFNFVNAPKNPMVFVTQKDGFHSLLFPMVAGSNFLCWDIYGCSRWQIGGHRTMVARDI